MRLNVISQTRFFRAVTEPLSMPISRRGGGFFHVFISWFFWISFLWGGVNLLESNKHIVDFNAKYPCYDCLEYKKGEFSINGGRNGTYWVFTDERNKKYHFSQYMMLLSIIPTNVTLYIKALQLRSGEYWLAEIKNKDEVILYSYKDRKAIFFKFKEKDIKNEVYNSYFFYISVVIFLTRFLSLLCINKYDRDV